jgi:5'(3')-deoxyribonucleotidase
MKQILSEEFLRMQKLAGIISETVDKALDTKVGLLLKDLNTKTSINSLIKDMPAEPKGSTMTKLPDDKMHVTLTSIKSFKPFKDKLKDFQLPEDIKFPNVELGDAKFVYREDGKTTYVAAVKNQNDIKEFVDKIYQKIGETNPEPNRFFHITLANNEGGDPFKSIGNVEKSDLIKENENSSLHFFFDLDGVLADMENGLQQSPEIIELRKILDDLINNNFPEYKNLMDDKIKEKIKTDLPPDAPANHPLRPLKKAFNNYTSKVFSVASKEGFYKNLPLMPGAKEMLKKAQEISGKKPDILSSPVQGENTSVQEKKDWVNTNFGDLVNKIIIDTDKGKYAKSKNDVLIDDRPKYINAFESSGGSAILHKNYNDTIKEIEKFKQSLTENKNKMKNQILSEEFRRMQKLAGLITESEYKKALLTEATDQIPGKDGIIILVSDYAKKHIMEHNKPGIGSIFKAGVTEDEIVNMVKEAAPKVSGDGGAYELNKPGIGYDLVLTIDKAKALKDAKEGEVEKQEGPNKVKVISITTSQPLSSFSSDRISLIIRKSNPQFLPDDIKTDADIAKKIEEGKCYSLLTAFPGNPDIPRASEWDGKFAIIIPGGVKESLNEVLDDLKDAQTAAEFIYTQLDTYIDNNLDGYGSGYHVESKLEKLLKLVSKKFNIPENLFKIDDKSSTEYNDYDEGTTNGEIKLNNQSIITYSSHDDGYGFRGDIDKNALKTELEKLIKPINESIYTKKLVNEVLRRYRRMLNEELTISNDNYELPDFEEKKKQLNTLFPDGSIDRSNWKMFGSDSEEDFENSIEYGEIDSQRILGVIEAEIEDLFPGFEVSCIMYSGDEKANIMVKKGNDSLSFDLKVDVL